MDDEIKKLIQEQYAKLPPALQRAIGSTHVHEQIGDIGKRNQLHIDQMGEFEEEITMLMLGFTDPIEFISEIKSSLHIDAEKAQKIATEVNQQILLPIRDAMAHDTTPDAPVISPEKSVVMPSAAKAASEATTTPITPVVPPAPAPTVTPTPTIPSNLPSIPMQKAEVMLTQPTASIAPKPATSAAPAIPAPAAPTTSTPEAAKPTVPPPPPAYVKTDPYREPPE